MQLKPRQIVGLAAIVVFGGVLAWTFLQPKPDPNKIPGALVINDAQSPVAFPSLSPVATPAPTPASLAPAVPADPAAAGSQEAKDDLYCAGLIFAAHRSAADPLAPAERRRVLMVPALASAGADRLIRECLATRETTAIFADAHTDKAIVDFAAGKPRIPLAACETRADAALNALGQ